MDRPPIDRSTVFASIVSLAGGVAMILASIGVIPFEPHRGEAPKWLLSVAGAAFALAGLGVMLLGLGRGSAASGELPPGAPAWMRIAQGVLALGAGTAIAVLGSWVAFGPGHRAFTFGGLITGPVSEGLGRAIFGVAAVVTWLCLGLAGAYAVRRMRRPG
jgi:hypothetical protein